MAANINFGPDTSLPRSHGQFHNFFPQWNAGLQATLATYCTTAIDAYNNPNLKSSNATYAVIQCLLDQMPNFRQVEMNVSSVILGLTPTLIQSLGMTTVHTGILSQRRPVLAFFLSVGSPVVSTLQPTDYSDKIAHELREPTGWYPKKLFHNNSSWARYMVSLAEYLLVFAAVANVSTLAYQLGYWSVSIFAIQITWLPALWTFLAFGIHIIGVFALRFRFKLHYPVDQSSRQHQERRQWRIVRWLERELIPAGFQPGIVVLRQKDNPWFHVLTWILYFSVIAHVLFGTMLLSSLLFISSSDAVGIAGKYALSTVACRLVMVFELMGMRHSGMRVEKGEPSEEKASAVPLNAP